MDIKAINLRDMISCFFFLSCIQQIYPGDKTSTNNYYKGQATIEKARKFWFCILLRGSGGGLSSLLSSAGFLLAPGRHVGKDAEDGIADLVRHGRLVPTL